MPAPSGANLLGGTYNADRLKPFSRPRHPQATFAKLCELPARRLAFVLTQHKIIFSCLFSTQKCCVSVSSCPDPRLDLLAHRERHAASPLGTRHATWPSADLQQRTTTSGSQEEHPNKTNAWIARRRVMCAVCVWMYNDSRDKQG